MDHFDTFDPNAEPFAVECLFHKPSPLSYDFNGFHEFPKRKGWGGTEYMDFDRYPQPEVDEFLQSWLYLGFLSEWTNIVGLQLNQDDFIRPDAQNPEKRWITTTKLPDYCKKWASQELLLLVELGEEEYENQEKSKIARLWLLLLDVLTCTNIILGQEGPRETKHLKTAYEVFNATKRRRLISDEFATAVKALYLTIYCAATKIWHFPSSKFIRPPFDGRDLFLSRLRDNGWCPHDMQYLGETVSMDICYYLCSYYPLRVLNEFCDCTLKGPDIKLLLPTFAWNGASPPYCCGELIPR